MIRFCCKSIVNFLIISILIIVFCADSFADRNIGVERIRSCASDTGQISGFEDMVVHRAIGDDDIGREMDFELTDPVCFVQLIAIYITFKAGVSAINAACNGNTVPRPYPSWGQDISDLYKASVKARKNKICAGVYAGAFAGNILAGFSNFGSAHATAKREYESVRVCGSEWFAPDPIKYLRSDTVKSSYSYKVTESVKRDGDRSAYYKEYLYGGKKFADNPSSGETCYDPINGGPQLYYLRGLHPGNFLCEKYNPQIYSSLGDQAKDSYKKAYDCCKKRRRDFICLEKVGYSNVINYGEYELGDTWNSGSHVFCQGNSYCTFPNNTAVVYKTYKRDNGRLICAKSSSICPFNFSVGGGTVYPDYYKDGVMEDGVFKPFISKSSGIVSDSDCHTRSEVRDINCKTTEKYGKLKNYCQWYSHCTIVDAYSSSRNFDNVSPYFSKACIDFVGDSQNGKAQTGLSFDPGLGMSTQTQFSAPIVQCIKETMYNLFKNTAGHSKCVDGTYGDRDNVCRNTEGQENYILNADGFQFKAGNRVKSVSMFEMIQVRLKTIITGVLVLSVAFLGFKILLGKFDFENKKEIMVYIFKIAFVIYFVNGDAWKNIFFDGIYNGSNEISRIFFKISSNNTNDKCNFGAMYNVTNDQLMRTLVVYPPNKEYLMIWDTLDCKIMEYLNYGPGFSSSSIFNFIVGSFVSGGIGLMFALSVMIVGFFMILVVIRAIHIFVSSAIAIIIYVFVSPIIIPLVLFERTKSIFDAWLSHLMSFTLQPIILFSYIAIFVTLCDQIFYGNHARDGNFLDCSKFCYNLTNNTKITNLSLCGKSNTSEVIDPTDKIAACIVRFDQFKKYDTFKSLGISLNALDSIITENPEVKIVLIMKTALFIFLLSQFMDEIPGITSRLIGENIDVKTAGYDQIAKKFYSAVRGVQKRAARLTQSGLTSMGSKTQDKASDEKEDKDKDKDGGGDSAGSSGGGDDKGGGSGGGDSTGGGGDSGSR